MNQEPQRLIRLAVTLLILVLAFGSFSGPVLAADDATLEVTVRDRWGTVPGATVQVTDPEREFGERQTSDSAGLATFVNLAAGTYRVEGALDGFVPFLEEGIVLAAGGQGTVEAMLALTQFSSSVTVTTANRREQLLLDVAEPTTLIDELQILDTGGLSAKDVLAEQAGAGIVVETGGGRGHVSINGVSNKGVLVLIDGRRYLGRNGIGDFNLEDLDLGGVERVEVVKGAGSALYGTDALGGVINIITKKAKQGTQNRVEMTVGSHSDVRISDSYGKRTAKYGLELISTSTRTIRRPRESPAACASISRETVTTSSPRAPSATCSSTTTVVTSRTTSSPAPRSSPRTCTTSSSTWSVTRSHPSSTSSCRPAPPSPSR